MAKQSFIWTCLPNGVTGDGRGLRVSVLMSPRLDAETDRPMLATFREWLDWPATLGSATVTLVADGQDIDRRRVSVESQPDSDVWRALFRPDIWVEGYRLNTQVLKSEILSHSATDIHDLVRDLYQDLAARTGDALPRIGSDLLENHDWRALVDAVEQVDQWGQLQDRPVTRQPDRDGASQIRRRFAGLRSLDCRAGTAAGNPAATVQHLKRFELFHTPPLKPKPASPAPRANDDRIEEDWQAFESPDMPDKNELAKRLDFHRVVAAMNAYPVLQRRLGLVMDFIIDRAALPVKDLMLRARVEFPPRALTTPRGPIDVMPITHVSHTTDGFFTASKPTLHADATRIDRGLLDLYVKPERYAVLQADVDGAGLKLMNFRKPRA